VEVLKTVAQQLLHTNQGALDFDDGQLGDGETPIRSSQARHLWETLEAAYRALGLDRACADEVFRQLVLARVIEPRNTPGQPSQSHDQLSESRRRSALI
jgi:hypothetical protein